ncbi:MAG: type II 3-dehydroquinate dehydratase [Coriobacteriia bacterium]|nr:type II 3-dehydroquinate dehydratase [Coriobacteriia bacterium]
MSKALQIAQEVIAAVGGKENVTANEICMTRLRIRTEDPTLVDAEQLTSTRGVLGIVQRGTKGIEVVFGPGKVEDVHDAIAGITGIESSDDPFDADSAPSPMSVIVNEKQSPAAAQASAPAESSPAEKDDLAAVESLISLLDETGAEKEAEAAGEGAALLVINGPNINMLGIREPGIYGTEGYADLLQLCKDAAAEAGFAKCTCYQSNHEGDLVDAIQDAYGTYEGIVINPGAYTHTSIAILDAAKAVKLPIVEVHISKVEEREDFRQVSYIRQACFETITGMGIQGYRKAILDLAEKLDL